MRNILSLEEMQQRYSGEWLLIAYTELDDELNVICGEVLAHSLNRDDIYATISAKDGKSVAIEYIGDIPEDLAVIL